MIDRKYAFKTSKTFHVQKVINELSAITCGNIEFNIYYIFVAVVIRAIGHCDRGMIYGRGIKNRAIKMCNAISTSPYELYDALWRVYHTIHSFGESCIILYLFSHVIKRMPIYWVYTRRIFSSWLVECILMKRISPTVSDSRLFQIISRLRQFLQNRIDTSPIKIYVMNFKNYFNQYLFYARKSIQISIILKVQCKIFEKNFVYRYD